jgi:protein-S-isoprenylcysteine O-methyltransferase Ste14
VSAESLSPFDRVEKAMKDPAGLMLATTVNCYWISVLLLAAIRWLRLRQGVGLLPRTRSERLMWILWVPVILLWNVLPRVALHNHRMPWGLPDFVRDTPTCQAVRCTAAAWGCFCFLLTLHCWFKMGRSWSLAVLPERATFLVQTGVFGLVRHPIYGLSIGLMLASVGVVPTMPMVAIALIHVTVVILKARSEERHLLLAHGQSYVEYTRRTGRFFPRIVP